MISVRPVNRLLGFGIRGMTPSDFVLLPLLLLCIWICAKSTLSFWFIGTFTHSTYSVSSIERVVASNKMVSIRKNTRSAHIEIPKVERFRMREEIRAPGRQKTPNYVCHEVDACWLPKHGPELLSGSSLLLGPSSSFLGSLFTLSDGCAQLSCTQGLPVPTQFKPKE